MLIEGFNSATGQWIGRTSQNRVLNFIAAPRGNGSAPRKDEVIGRYTAVRVLRAGPNSLAGECAAAL